MNLTWYPAGTDEPLDEQADLMAGYWAIIGPDHPQGYGWSVQEPGEGDSVASGKVADADEAKAAVVQWFSQGVDYSTGRVSTPPPGLVRL